MRVIVVEDDKKWQQFLRDEVFVGCDLTIFEAFDQVTAAFDGAQEIEADLIVLDLRIPGGLDGGEADAAHGDAVFARMLAAFRGTPIFFFTAYPNDDRIVAKIEHGRHEDCWCDGVRRPTIRIFRKGIPTELIDAVNQVKLQLVLLNEVDVDDRDVPGLTYYQRRILKLAARRARGSAIVPIRLTGGLSGASTFGAKITSGNAVINHCVIKIDTIEKVNKDSDCYVLASGFPHGLVPAVQTSITAGAGPWGASIYRFVGGAKGSLLRILVDDEDRAVGIVRHLAAEFAQRGAADIRTDQIRDFRRVLIDDEELLRCGVDVSSREWREVEDRMFEAGYHVLHGDLHFENVIVGETYAPVLIDFTTTAKLPVAFDPVTLELGLLFHPALAHIPRPELLGRAEAWPDANNFYDGSKYSKFAVACRAWAQEVARPREILVCAYSIMLRQLRFDDANADLRMPLLLAIRAKLIDSYQ